MGHADVWGNSLPGRRNARHRVLRSELAWSMDGASMAGVKEALEIILEMGFGMLMRGRIE